MGLFSKLANMNPVTQKITELVLVAAAALNGEPTDRPDVNPDYQPTTVNSKVVDEARLPNAAKTEASPMPTMPEAGDLKAALGDSGIAQASSGTPTPSRAAQVSSGGKGFTR